MNIDNIIKEEIARLNETAGKNMPDTFFDRVVQKLGGTPTAEKRRFFRAWKAAEDTNAKFNPLATKWDKQVPGQTDSNKVGVKNYPDQETGLSATVNTLTKGIGANAYKNIVNKLKQDDITAEELVAEKSELDTWGTGGDLVASVLGSKQTTDTEPTPDANDTEEDPIDVATADDEKLIDTIQNWLDFAGFIPVIGDAIDVVNGLIYFIRGQYVNATLSMIAIIPGIGSAVAVPLRVAWKSAKRVFKPSVIASISRGGPGMSKLLLNLVQEGKISPNTLKGLADAGDDVAKLIQDTSKTLADIPGAKDISKRTDAFGDYIKSLFKEVDDAAKLAAKSAADQAQLLKALKTNKAAKIVTDLVVAPITIPLNIIKRSIGKKTFRGFTDPTALTAMQSRLNKKYVDRLSKGQGMDAILKRTDLSDIQSENILNFMRRSDISLGGLSKADMSKLTPSQFKKYYKGAGIQNLPANQRKSLLSHISNNSSTFPEFNKYFRGYKKQFIEREMSKLRNLSATTGSKRFLINKADNLFSNVNVPKGFAKMYTVGELLEDTSNPMLQDLGEAIRALSYDTYEFFKITSIAEPGNEQDQKDIINQQEKVDAAVKEVEKAQELVRNIDPDSLTEEDKEILYLLTQVEKAYGLK